MSVKGHGTWFLKITFMQNISMFVCVILLCVYAIVSIPRTNIVPPRCNVLLAASVLCPHGVTAKWSSRVKCTLESPSRVVLACIFYLRVLIEGGPRGCFLLACVYESAPVL